MLKELDHLLFNHNRPKQPMIVKKFGNQPEIPIMECVSVAAKYGHLKIVQWLVSEEIKVEPQPFYRLGKTLVPASVNGQTHIVNYALEELRRQAPLCVWESSLSRAFQGAAQSGRIETLDCLIKAASQNLERCLLGNLTQSVDSAASAGQMEVLHWMKENYVRGFSHSAMQSALKENRLEVIKFLRENKLATLYARVDSLQHAIRSSRLDILRYFEAHCANVQAEWPNISIDDAISEAKQQTLEVVEFLHERGAKCTKKAMDAAARAGCLDIVTFLHTYRDEGCSSKALDEAACNGHLEVVRYLYEAGKRLASVGHVFKEVVKGGHLGVLKWFLEQNISYQACHPLFEWGPLVYAAKGGHLETCTFLCQNWQEGCLEDLRYGLPKALENGHLDSAKLLYELSPRLSSDPDPRRAPTNNRILSSALCRGHTEVVAWMYKHLQAYIVNIPDFEIVETELGEILFLQCWLNNGAKEGIIAIRSSECPVPHQICINFETPLQLKVDLPLVLRNSNPDFVMCCSHLFWGSSRLHRKSLRRVNLNFHQGPTSYKFALC